MPNLQHKHGGVVLAAGASSRMGQPKALLPTPSGRPLAVEQALLLRQAGAADIVVVLGKDAETVAAALDAHQVRCAYNAAWASGRLSSLQTGLSALASEIAGALVIPVDAAFIRPETAAAVLREADLGRAAAVRPCHHDRPGHLLWISRSLFPALLGQISDPSFRVDHWIAPHEHRIQLDDPALLNNFNTPASWRMPPG